MAGSTTRISVTVVREMGVNSEIRDSELSGFGVRRQRGRPRYFVQVRIHGRLKRMTIGTHGSPWTPELARREAARLLVAVRKGEDPASERTSLRSRATTFDVVSQEYLELHGPKLKERTRAEYARLIEARLRPEFGKLTLAEITAKAVARAHVKWREAPRTANHAVSVLSSVLSWAETHGYMEEGQNPCAKVERYRENARERYLSEEELVRLGEALSAAEADGANLFVVAAVRLLVLTGARLSEILTLQWPYVDLERGVLRLPDSKTGAKTILLSAAAMRLLDSLPRSARADWVFPGHSDGRHLVNLQKPWRAIRTRAGLGDVRIHDLRHSYASFAVDAGGSLPIIGRLLGHSQSQTTARYAHVAPHPARALADGIGERIEKAWSSGAEKSRALPSPAPSTGNEED